MGPEGVDLGGDNVRLEQAPDRGLELRITVLDDDGHARSVASVFAAGDDPPPALPVDVPFVPGAAIHVIEDYERDVMLASWRIEDPSSAALTAAFDRVVALSRESGWRLAGAASRAGAVLERAGRRRRVQATSAAVGPVVTVADGPA
jgi:hypothetical protein